MSTNAEIECSRIHDGCARQCVLMLTQRHGEHGGIPFNISYFYGTVDGNRVRHGLRPRT